MQHLLVIPSPRGVVAEWTVIVRVRLVHQFRGVQHVNIAKLYAQVLGAVLLLVGILGFVPALAPDNNLLGIFAIDGFHNVIHILSGVVGLAAGLSSGGRYA